VDRVYAVTATKRRRYLWAAWWTGAPAREPFRAPDAWMGGARTPAEARAAAEQAAGGSLSEIDAMWVRAWLRLQRGQAPWIVRPPKPPREARDPRPVAGRFVVPRGTSPFTVLGLTPMATPAEIKRAFRRLALVTHPDRGGEARAFMLATWAHDEALRQSGQLR
jgi:hypothetical protein